MLRFTWSRLWRSTWQHVGSLGRGLYSNYDYYVIKSLDTIEFRVPNTGYTERFVVSGGSYIPAPGVKYRSLITEATATHVTIRLPGGLKLRFEITNYIENGAYNRCRLQHIEDLSGNQITTYDAAYANPQTNSRLGNPFTFTGRELDDETLLYYYPARTYDPVQGRFKQLDPSGTEHHHWFVRDGRGKKGQGEVDRICRGKLNFGIDRFTSDLGSQARIDPNRGNGHYYVEHICKWRQHYLAIAKATPVSM